MANRSVYDIEDGDSYCVAFVPGTDVTIDPFELRRSLRDETGKPWLECYGVVRRGGGVDSELTQLFEELVFCEGFCKKTLLKIADHVLCQEPSPATSPNS